MDRVYYAYDGKLRFSDIVYHADDCPAGCDLTEKVPPDTPWPDGQWPYFVGDEWELVEVHHLLAG